ncbi:hypothetical protein IQ244_13155 [Nostoc sp. LEGE 06077]|uniref:hypothetical protein n=1 Tax=Nostoc sp. LEGE 06077 TaxID=915325 RepID=UPI001880FEF9|nr:hypothetical protein [Nostoc sp. LEGE 06077]MBE9207453.1 hypothetical protein [Nostoc sp. LEGE 06077]
MATSIVFVPQTHAQAQDSRNRIEQASSRVPRSLEVQWLLGFIPWPTFTKDSNRHNLSNNTTYANNPNNSIPTNINSPNRPKLGNTKQGYNHKEVPVPILIPGLVALGAGLIRKHRQEQKQIEVKVE